MFGFRRASIAPTLAIALAVFAAGTAAAETDEPKTAPHALSSEDRISYTTAFDALRRGDLELARESARRAGDRVLLGQVEFERLFHADYSATYEELAAWLDQYADLPCAPRAYALAMRRRPDGAPEPKRPGGVLNRTWDSLRAAATGLDAEDIAARGARIAYNEEDFGEAYRLGSEIGDWWTAGLAAYRLNNFHDAFRAFERVAEDPTEGAWVRAGAGVWAAKAAAQSGRQDQVQTYLRLAARWPATFYGQVALRQLGEEPTIENLGPQPYGATLQHASWQPDEPIGVDQAELAEFVQSDPRARRTVAFLEVGRRSDAQDELRTGLRTAVNDAARRLWTGLARALGPRVTGASGDLTRIDANNYPLPVLEPEGGFTIERALVYAIARKETGFNAEARSSVGAYGMMQVMPTTAAEMTGDRGFVSEPQRLLVPAVNLKLGQTYINRMLQQDRFQGDLLRAVASYNAGPGPMLTALRKLGPNADPLLLIETLDVPQARQYVEEVVAAYWIYQRLFGGPLNTLDAVAGGASLVPVSLDYVPPAPAPVEVAALPVSNGQR